MDCSTTFKRLSDGVTIAAVVSWTNRRDIDRLTLRLDLFGRWLRRRRDADVYQRIRSAETASEECGWATGSHRDESFVNNSWMVRKRNPH
jgi:hypothetical protein